jgi:hypothetical protein
MRMMESWRPLALAAALNMIAGVGVARAQTVAVTNAPPGSTVELVLNTTPIGSVAADARGDARLPLNFSADAGKTEMDANVSVEACDNVLRVLVVERGQQRPPVGAGCSRRDVEGLYLVRRVTTLVVDVSGPNPAIWLRQGAVTLHPSKPPRAWSSSPTGLVVSGGGGLAKLSNVVSVACGNVTECSGDKSGIAYTAGVAYWLTAFLAAEASYVKPAKAATRGSGNGFRFDSGLDAHVLTFVGKIGAPLGRLRLYGEAGANYHRATFATTETVDDLTTTIDGVTTTIPGGTQTFELRTAGWGWVFGGGLDVWMASSFAIYAEGGRAVLKGSARDNGEGAIDDRLTFLLLGARVRIGR